MYQGKFETGARLPTADCSAGQRYCCPAGGFELYGASCGNECVAAIQKDLSIEGLAQMVNSQGQLILGVTPFVNQLLVSGYSETNAPVPGDIVDLGGDHIGVYTGDGYMISNSSTPGEFVWYDLVSNQAAQVNAGYVTYYHHQ